MTRCELPLLSTWKAVGNKKHGRAAAHLPTAIPTEYARVNASASAENAPCREVESGGQVGSPHRSTAFSNGKQWAAAGGAE